MLIEVVISTKENPCSLVCLPWVDVDAVSWSNKKQTSVALSKAEAEFIACSAAVQEAKLLSKRSSGLNTISGFKFVKVDGPAPMFADGESAITLVKDKKISQSCKAYRALISLDQRCHHKRRDYSLVYPIV